MRALVVDDEPPARRRLARMLEVLDCQVVAEAGDAETAVALARLHSPAVMFLDIRMPGVDGLTLARRSIELPPIVFCTAWAEHAVEAFEVNAVDYLLKPVRAERLAAAVDKVRLGQLAAKRATDTVLNALAPASATRVVTTGRGVVRFFDARAVTRFWADEKYTVFAADGEEHLTDESLNELEARLGPHGFTRTHRAELVRLDAVRSLCVDEAQHTVLLSDGQRARVSRRSLAAVKDALGL